MVFWCNKSVHAVGDASVGSCTLIRLEVVRQGAWGGQLSIPTSAAATEDTPTQIALASLIGSQLLSLPCASVAPADDRDSVTSTSTLAALRMTPAVAGAGMLASSAGEHADPPEMRQEVRPDPTLSVNIL